MAQPKSVEKTCPCCKATLVIDLETGEILMHKEVKKGPAMDMNEAVRSLHEQAGKRDEMFQKNLEAEKKREDLLKKKFEEALKKAKENPDDKPPPREIDLD